MNDHDHEARDLDDFGDTLLRERLDVAMRGVTPDVERLVHAGRTKARRHRAGRAIGWVVGIAATSTLVVLGTQQSGLLGGSGPEPGPQATPTTIEPVTGQALVPADARGLAAAVVAHLDGAEVRSIEGRTIDQGAARSLAVRIELSYGTEPGYGVLEQTLWVTAWQPGSEGFDPGAVSCSAMSSVDYSRRALPGSGELVSFGCEPGPLLPDAQSEWWVAADTVQSDGSGTAVDKQLTVLLVADRPGGTTESLRPGIDALRGLALDDAVGSYTTEELMAAGQHLPAYTEVEEFSD